MTRTFDSLVAEAESVSVDGWDFSWLDGRHPEDAVADATRAGLEVVDLRSERPDTEFHDIGAVIYFLRKVIWMVPGFTVGQYRDRLRELHEQIERDGPFVAHTARFLIEARKTGRREGGGGADGFPADRLRAHSVAQVTQFSA